MDRITPPLKLQMVRPEVAGLHAALASLGHDIAVDESARQRFGKTTRAAVLAFQTQHQLPPTGVVDRDTASALNAILGEPRESAGPSPAVEPTAGRAVAGTVAHADGSSVAGMAIRAYHRRIAGEELLGETRTTDRGQYAISYQLPAGLSAIDLF